MYVVVFGGGFFLGAQTVPFGNQMTMKAMATNAFIFNFIFLNTILGVIFPFFNGFKPMNMHAANGIVLASTNWNCTLMVKVAIHHQQ